MRRAAAAAAAALVAVVLAAPGPPGAAAEPEHGLRATPLQGVPSSVAALMLSGTDGGPLAVSLLVLPLGPAIPAAETAEPARHRVGLQAEVDGATLLAAAPDGTLSLDAYAYVLTPEGAVAGFIARRFSVDAEEFDPDASTAGLTLPLHLELAAGSHELRVLVRDAASGRHGLRSITLQVPATATARSAPPTVGSSPGAAGGGVPGSTLEPGDLPGRHGRDRGLGEAASSAYRAVLRRLASGDPDGAAEDLARLERELLARAEGQIALLQDVEMAVAEELAPARPQALVPVARLHHLAYRRAREGGRFALAVHSRSMAVAVVELYAAQGGEGAAELAAGFVAAVGEELQEARLYRTARDHLDRAVALDGGNTFALLHLAVGLERTGEPERAVEVLERLVATDPKSPEARLRLGIASLRIGGAERGRSVLQRLVREHNPEWVLAVAYQELARERLGSGDAAGAVLLLQEAVARLPEQGRLALQLAYALERAGRPREARVALERYRPSAEPEGSPRHRYGLRPEGERTPVEEALDRATLLRLAALGEALRETASPEGRR